MSQSHMAPTPDGEGVETGLGVQIVAKEYVHGNLDTDF